MEEKKRILVLGIGNLILKDEGIGVHVVQKIMGMPLPPDVEVMDGGTIGINLLYAIEGREKVIVIDAVNADSPPGTLYRFTDKDLEQYRGYLRSAHEIDFVYVLNTAKFMGNSPRKVIFIGITPEDISEGLELSPVIEAKIPQIINLVVKEVESK